MAKQRETIDSEGGLQRNYRDSTPCPLETRMSIALCRNSFSGPLYSKEKQWLVREISTPNPEQRDSCQDSMVYSVVPATLLSYMALAEGINGSERQAVGLLVPPPGLSRMQHSTPKGRLWE